jgi:hypothetical protein
MAKQRSSTQAPEPPQPPEMERRIQLYPFQWIGIPLLFLLPVLALFGVFGAQSNTVQRASDLLAMQVEYPTRYRYKMIEPMAVNVSNLSGQTPVTITVDFSRSYIEQFSAVNFTPAVKEITQNSYRVELPNVPAGETRRIAVELQAEQYWRHAGNVAAAVVDEAPVVISVETWVFP